MPMLIYLNRPYALFFKDVGKYLKFAERDDGVDLVWSDEPVYEWVFRKEGLHYFDKNDRVSANDRVALLNTKRGLNYYLAYSGQPVGVTLNLVLFEGNQLEPNLGTFCQWKVSGESHTNFSLYKLKNRKCLH